ncbi:PAS domain S-box-containing protein [Stenotrophomonas maltophilia]|uniref:sensor histidine kinase n=1 Tax=Stenotrophomonas chelatiphaga TaxID=517011 RepID=UPI000F4B9686|nr:PAS domain-containing protein [Stenotrophomonas chelatiphaga]MCS4229676.1 PAS domain S-box-containing protein [Stenotrophomonas chelatiphaga]ROQ36918.1 PAS domain S-box-containing protein [Stenotrophomonas maltophilia]
MSLALTDALAIDAILDDTRVGVWQFDTVTRQLRASDTASAQLAGIGAQALRSAWRRILRQEQDQPVFEIELPWTDGISRRWLMLRGRHDRALGQVHGMCVDMTRRVRAEQLVREQAILLDTLARGTPPRECLRVLTEAIERLKPGLRSAFFVTPGDRQRPGYGSSCNVHPAITALLEHADAAPQAAHLELPDGGDAATDTAWHANWRAACIDHCSPACRPIAVARQDQPERAWLLLFLSTPRALSGWEQEVASFATRIAALVLDREDQQIALQQAADAVGRALHDTERERRRLQAFLDSSPDLAYVFNLEHRFTYANRALLRMWGKTEEEALGRTCLELGYPDWHAAMHSREIEQVIATRRPIRGDVPFEGPLGRRMYDYIFVPQLGLDGEVEAIIGTTRDVTERSEHEDERARNESLLRMLVDELQHRTRNIMSVVRAMASRTLATSRDMADFSIRFDARLDALARAQSLLSRLGELDRVQFDVLLRAELSAHVDPAAHDDQIVLEGPAEVPLRSGTVQPLAMALHELATNAVKYGALRQQGGRLHVRWNLVDAGASEAASPRLRVDWQEHGVRDLPADPASIRGGGAGRELIERALPYQIGAKVDYGFAEDGLRCSILLAVSEQAVALAD